MALLIMRLGAGSALGVNPDLGIAPVPDLGVALFRAPTKRPVSGPSRKLIVLKRKEKKQIEFYAASKNFVSLSAFEDFTWSALF